MTSIKVVYQSTVRRFTIPNTTTWSDLESNLRLLFSLPPTFKFTLSYNDEEGDTITLSTDLELQEFLSSQSSQPTLKFLITPEKQPNFIVDTFLSNVSENDFVSVEREKLIPDNVSEESDKHVTVMDTVDDDDESYSKPTAPSVSKGKQKESPTFAANNNQQHEENQQPSPNDHERRAPFIELAEQFQQLLDQFKDVLSKNPQLVEQANTVMDQILQNVPVDIDQWAQWLNTFRPEDIPTDAQGGETDNSRGGEQQQQQQQQQRANDFGHFGQFPSFIPPHVLLSNPWIQKIFQDVSANYPGLDNFARSTGFNGGCPYRQQKEEELSQEALKEKINLLHTMGFWEDDIKNEELLKRYNGNVERVIEILIRQQNERVN